MGNVPATTVICIKPVHILCPCGAGKYDRAIHECIEIFPIRYLLQGNLHGHIQCDFISGFPFAVNGQVLSRLGIRFLYFSINRNAGAFSPGGVTEFEAECFLLALFHAESDLLFVGETGFLYQGYLFLFPGQTGGDEEVYIQRILCMGVNKLSVFGVILQSRTDATPHGCFRLRINAIVPRTHRSEVNKSTLCWLL